MKIITHVMTVAAVGLWFVAPASAQLGLGGGGNAGAGADVGNAVQGAAQGVGNAARNIEQGTRNIQRGARQLGGDTVQRTRQGVQNQNRNLQNQNQNLRGNFSGQQRFNGQNGQYQGNAQFRAGNQQGNIGANASNFVQANTPEIPARAQANAQFNAQADRDARWRKTRHNGEWWYYSPEGNWMYMRDGQWNKYNEQDFQHPYGDGNYSSNYDSSSNGDSWTQDGRSVYRLQSDNQGRQYIRMNGRQIWVGSDADASVRGGRSNRGANLDLNTDADAEVGTE